MSKFVSSIVSITYRIICTIFLFLIVYTFLSGLFITIKMPVEGFYIFEKKFYFLAYILVIIILFLIYLIDKKKLSKRKLLIALILLISLSIIYGSSLPFSVTNTDSYTVLNIARESLDLNLDELKIFLSNNNYLNYYPHQFDIYSLNYILVFLFKVNADFAFTI